MAAAAAAAVEGEPRLLVRRARGASWRITAPSPLLDGHVPLRAAQACAPFLAGNAAGWWLSPPEPIVLRVDSRRVVANRPGVSVSLRDRSARVSIATGLVVEPIDAALVVERAFNRSDERVTVERARVERSQELVLSLSIPVERSRRELVLDGPLASMMLTPRRVRWIAADQKIARAMIERHASFFDASYFRAKRAGPTKRYRAMSRAPLDALVDPSIADGALFTLGPSIGVEEDALLVRAECAVEAEHYGAVTRCVVDRTALAARASAMRSSLARVGAALDPEHPAFAYWSQYAVAHVGGDPHVLLKPSLLVATRARWRLVIDGDTPSGLRGVTEGAWFHAAPVVLAVRGAMTLAAGAPLARVRVVPESMLRAPVEER